MRTIAGSLAALVCMSAVIAQEMTMAPPPKELGWVEFLNGTWSADMTMMDPSGKASKGKGRIATRRSMGGMYFESDFSMKMDGMDFYGKQLLSYDAQKKGFVAWWFDSVAPGAMEMHGNMDGKMLRMVSTPTPVPGMPEKVVFRVTYTKLSSARVDFKLEMKQGDTWAPMMNGVFTKLTRGK